MRLRGTVLIPLLAGAATFGPTIAQDGQPASPVRYTESQEYPVQRAITLPGTVESRTSSIVASEIEGIVVELLAREGQTVRKGQPLARLRTVNLELMLKGAQSQLKEAEARLGLAEVNLERARGLFATQVASRQDLDNATYERDALSGRVDDLKSQISRFNLALELSTIRAPFAGMVTAERTDLGQWVASGGPIADMLSLSDLEIRVEVPERYFSSLDPTAIPAVTFDAIPGLEVKGRIAAIIAKADTQSHTFPLKVAIANPEGRIGAGMLASVSFTAGAAYRATVVPRDAVVTQSGSLFVYRMDSESKVALVPVDVGQGVGDWVVVEGEIKPGQKVITRGNERLRPGAQVEGQPLPYTLP